MRIGIVTFHCAYNYGSALQAYALQRYLEKLGHQAWIIHYLSPDFDNYRYLFIRRPFRRFFKDHSVMEIPKEIVKDVLLFPKRKKRTAVFRGFWKRYDHLTRPVRSERELAALNRDFDAFICGGDQIWSPGCVGKLIEPFFLSFAQKRRVSYAPSLGQTKLDGSVDGKRLGELLDRLDAISVREESAAQILGQYTKKPITPVVDPVLLLEQADYEAMEEVFPIHEPYLMFYSIEDASPKVLAQCRRIADQHHWKIVHFFAWDHMGSDTVSAFGCTPGQWLYLLRHAEFVLTNSYHAMLFSLICQKPFSVMVPKETGVRQTDFMRQTGLEHRIFVPDTELRLDTEDEKAAMRKVAEKRENSEMYLKNALNGNE